MPQSYYSNLRGTTKSNHKSLSTSTTTTTTSSTSSTTTFVMAMAFLVISLTFPAAVRTAATPTGTGMSTDNTRGSISDINNYNNNPPPPHYFDNNNNNNNNHHNGNSNNNNADGDDEDDDDIYNYYFNDHSMSGVVNGGGGGGGGGDPVGGGGGGGGMNEGGLGYTTDPYRHNDEYSIDLAEEWAKIGSRIRRPKCVNIPSNMTLCQGIGYDRMMLPNILEHDTLGEVTAQARSWVPLININCHPDAKVFLCSLFSPICLDRLIYPCRSLCQAVHANCGRRMKAHGFDWPEMLECHKFPEDNDMCIKIIHNVIADNNCVACRHPLTFESMVDHFCRASVVIKATLRSFNDVLGNRELVLRKKRRVYKAQGVSKRMTRKLTPVIQGGASCDCAAINKTQGRYLLMGHKRDDKLIIIFGIPWNKKDKDFTKGLKAIRKTTTCEGIFTELSKNGMDTRSVVDGPGEKSTDKKGGKGRGGKGKGKGRGKGKGKGKKGRGKGKKGGKKGKGGKGKKGKGKKGKGRKGKGKGGKGSKKRDRNRKGDKNDVTTNMMVTGGGSRPGESQREKWAREDKALNNFMKADN